MYTHCENTVGARPDGASLAPCATFSPPAAATIPLRSPAAHRSSSGGMLSASSREHAQLPTSVSSTSAQHGDRGVPPTPCHSTAPRATISVAAYAPGKHPSDTATNYTTTTYELCRQKRVSRQNAPATQFTRRSSQYLSPKPTPAVLTTNFTLVNTDKTATMANTAKAAIFHPRRRRLRHFAGLPEASRTLRSTSG